MTAKRFKLRLSKLGNGMITDTQKRKDLYFDKEFLDVTLTKTKEWLNELAEENQELKRLVKATVEDYTDLKQSFDLIDKENEQLKQGISKLQSKYDKSKTDEVNILVETENTVLLKKKEFEEYVRRHNELRRRNKRRKEKNRKYRNELKKRLREITGLKEFIAEDLSSEDKVLKGFIEEYL